MTDDGQIGELRSRGDQDACSEAFAPVRPPTGRDRVSADFSVVERVSAQTPDGDRAQQKHAVRKRERQPRNIKLTRDIPKNNYFGRKRGFQYISRLRSNPKPRSNRSFLRK
jgi:hypothetical protein